MDCGPCGHRDKETEMPEVTVTPGKDTSEYDAVKKTAGIAKVMTVLGLIVTFGGSIVQALGVDSKVGIIAGAVVAIAGVLIEMLNGLGYAKARSLVKASAAAAVAKIVASPKE